MLLKFTFEIALLPVPRGSAGPEASFFHSDEYLQDLRYGIQFSIVIIPHVCFAFANHG